MQRWIVGGSFARARVLSASKSLCLCCFAVRVLRDPGCRTSCTCWLVAVIGTCWLGAAFGVSICDTLCFVAVLLVVMSGVLTAEGERLVSWGVAVHGTLCFALRAAWVALTPVVGASWVGSAAVDGLHGLLCRGDGNDGCGHQR